METYGEGAFQKILNRDAHLMEFWFEPQNHRHEISIPKI